MKKSKKPKSPSEYINWLFENSINECKREHKKLDHSTEDCYYCILPCKFSKYGKEVETDE